MAASEDRIRLLWIGCCATGMAAIGKSGPRARWVAERPRPPAAVVRSVSPATSAAGIDRNLTVAANCRRSRLAASRQANITADSWIRWSSDASSSTLGCLCERRPGQLPLARCGRPLRRLDARPQLSSSEHPDFQGRWSRPAPGVSEADLGGVISRASPEEWVPHLTLAVTMERLTEPAKVSEGRFLTTGRKGRPNHRARLRPHSPAPRPCTAAASAPVSQG